MTTSARYNRVQWFSDLSARFGILQDPRLNLLVELPIQKLWFDELRKAVSQYLEACLGYPEGLTSEQSLVDLAGDKLANRTASGIIIPKQEFQTEYNQLHRVVASWFSSLGIQDLVHQLMAPVGVRLIKGEAAAEAELSTYENTKLHTDVWNKEPFDFAPVMIPILGDIERTSTEVFHPPENFEEKYLRRMDDFDEGSNIWSECVIYPKFRRGYGYILDGILPHRTVRTIGKTRVTLTIPVRRKTTDAERRATELECGAGRLSHYVNVQEWITYGSSKFLKFKDTYADAEKGIYNEFPYDSPIYDVVASLP